MIISPMQQSPAQQDYVTKGEFGEFKDENKIEHLELKNFMNDGFDKMEEYIDVNVAILSKEIQQSKMDIISHIDRVMKVK